MTKVTEKELREAIQHALKDRENKKILSETAYGINIEPEELWEYLIEPWINVLKIAKLEAQKTLANVLFLFKSMITFNTEKLQNLRDRHADRKRALNQETQKIVDDLDLGFEGNAIAFLINPAAYIAGGGMKAAEGAADFFRGAGIGDFMPGELSSPDRESLQRAREREESNPIMKAIRALDSLFMAGHAPQGGVLLEQEEDEAVEEDFIPVEERDYSEVKLNADGIQMIIDSGGGLADQEEAKKGLMQDAQEFFEAVDTAKKLVDVLAATGRVTNLDEYVGVLDQVSKISPETGVSGRGELEQLLDADVKQILSTEGAEQEAAEAYLRKQGVKEPEEEELAEVTDEQKMGEVRSIAFGNILGQLRKGAAEAINGIYENHKEIYDSLYDEEKLDAGAKAIIDASEYGKIMNTAKELLKSMESSASSTGA
jgi:hypothetical protein